MQKNEFTFDVKIIPDQEIMTHERVTGDDYTLIDKILSWYREKAEMIQIMFSITNITYSFNYEGKYFIVSYDYERELTDDQVLLIEEVLIDPDEDCDQMIEHNGMKYLIVGEA